MELLQHAYILTLHSYCQNQQHPVKPHTAIVHFYIYPLQVIIAYHLVFRLVSPSSDTEVCVNCMKLSWSNAHCDSTHRQSRSAKESDQSEVHKQCQYTIHVRSCYVTQLTHPWFYFLPLLKQLQWQCNDASNGLLLLFDHISPFCSI